MFAVVEALSATKKQAPANAEGLYG